MSLSLLASNYEDGVAIIREKDSGGTYVVRPPYDRASRVMIDSGDVQEAITKHGFAAENTNFPNYASLIEHLETKLSESRKGAGIPIPEEPPLVEALKLAPMEIISGFLKRIEHELIPQKKWDHAENLLINILVARTEAEIRSEAQQIHKRLGISRNQSNGWKPKDVRFVGAESCKGEKIGSLIVRRGCILEPSV